MIGSDFDDPKKSALLFTIIDKLTSERAKERADAAAALRDTPPEVFKHNQQLASALIAAMCLRLPLEAAGATRKGGPTAQSKGTAAVRDCKWAVQCGLQACQGRLSPESVRAVVAAVSGLAASDLQALGEFVSAVCNRLVFSTHPSYAYWIDAELWGQTVTAITKAVCGVDGARRPCVHNEADLLCFLLYLSLNCPSPFLQNAQRVLGLAAASFAHAVDLPDLAICSATVDTVLLLLNKAREEGCLLELPLTRFYTSSWIKYRALAQQSPCAELHSFLIEHVEYDAEELKRVLLEEIVNGRLCNQTIAINEYFNGGSSSNNSKSHYLQLLRLIARCIEHRELLQVTSVKFAEAKAFQVIAAGSPTLGVACLLDRLERSAREAHPFILLCLAKSIQAALSVYECETVCRLCSMAVLRGECRDAALLCLTVVVERSIATVHLPSLDQQIEVLLVMMEGRDANLRFVNLLLTYLEVRFGCEYWTQAGEKMLRAVLDWITRYPASSIPVGYLCRLRRLPLALQECEDAGWSLVLFGRVPAAFDLALVEKAVLSSDRLDASLSEEMIKFLVKSVEGVGSVGESPQVLTLIDSLHHSPFGAKSADVDALSLIQGILCKQSGGCGTVFLQDAQRYLVRKIGGLEAHQLAFFIQTVPSLAGIEEQCAQAVVEHVVGRQPGNDPFFCHTVLQACVKCSPLQSDYLCRMARLALKLIKNCCCTAVDEHHLLTLATMVDDKALFLDLCPRVSLDVLHGIVQDESLLADKLLSVAHLAHSLTIKKWTRTGFVAERGQLFVEILCRRISNQDTAPLRLDCSAIDSALQKVLPAVGLRLLSSGLALDRIPIAVEQLYSPLMVRYGCAVPREHRDSSSFAVLAERFLKKPKVDLYPNAHLVYAYVLLFAEDGVSVAVQSFESMSAADWLLLLCHVSNLVMLLPFACVHVLKSVGRVFAGTAFALNTFSLDMLYKTALSLTVPRDLYGGLLEEILRQITDLHTSPHSLKHSLPLLLLQIAAFHADVPPSLSAFGSVVRLCRGESVEVVEPRLVDVVVGVLGCWAVQQTTVAHIVACCKEPLRSDPRVLRFADPCLSKLPLECSAEQSSRVDVVELLAASALTSASPAVFLKFAQWVLQFKSELDVGVLEDVDARLVKLFAEPLKLPIAPLSQDGDGAVGHIPAFLACALSIGFDQSVQAEIYFHAFLHRHRDSEAGTLLLSSLLTAAVEAGTVSRALLKMVSYACRTPDVLLTYHSAFARLFQQVGHVMDAESSAYCMEALRLGGSGGGGGMEGEGEGGMEGHFKAAIECFKHVDRLCTLGPSPDCISMLCSLSKDGDLKGVQVQLEDLILADTWDLPVVPSSIVSFHDRQVYCKVKMQVPHPADLDPFVQYAAALRSSSKFDPKVALEWFDAHDASALCSQDKARLAKMTDRIARLHHDSSCALAAGMLACKLLARAGRTDESIQGARFLVDKHRSELKETHPSLLSLALSKLAKWLEQGKAAIPKEVLEEYLEPAYKMAPAGTRAHSKALYRLAWFLDRQVSELRTSELLHAKAAIIKNSRQQLDVLRTAIPGKASKEKQTLDRNRVLLETQLSIDQEEYSRLVRDKTGYLVRLLEYYLRVLVLSNDRDLLVFRFCSLWFACGDEDLEAVNDRISSVLPSVPSHKFLPVMYQLAAKYQTLSQSSKMYSLLTQLLKRLLHKHPFHSVMQFIALSHGHVTHSGSKRHLDSSDRNERNNARDLLGALRATKSTSDTIRAIELVAAAYIELAELDIDPTGRNTHAAIAIPKHLLVAKLADTKVPILTKHLEPNAEGSYHGTAVFLQSLDSTFKVVGGINLPKVIECIGSDGQRYRQLVKGRDDLRQDAVVEQVFRLVNRMSMKHQKASIAPLRCYRVVPLHQRAGVLEWVAEAIPIGDYLIGAHERYHPHDWTPSHARHVARAEAERPGSTFASKLQVFGTISANLRPVFHYFFLERFMAVDRWLAARQGYQLSCASASMMGYVIGLGDRHCQNILIDCQSGHLIHIDLNMIFEQGRTLRIPERVPFRLTADLRDAMGPYGIDHGFRQSAIDFMSEIRQRAEGVLMVLEVFKHDPLHHWPSAVNTVVAFDKLSDLQTPSALFKESTNHIALSEQQSSRYDTADRALLRVREKVAGREEGAQISVPAQVQHLIQQAVSPELLSQMYAGWQPWL